MDKRTGCRLPGGRLGAGRKGEGVKQRQNLPDTDNSRVMTRGRGGGGGRGGYRGQMVTEGDLTLGGEHAVQHAGGVW